MTLPSATRLRRLGDLVPGVALAAAIGVIATALARGLGTGLLGYEKSPISPVLLAVFLGLLVRNTAGLSDGFAPGLRFSVRRLLRFGVALLGIRLSLTAVASIGLAALPIVLTCIAAALFVVMALARALRLPSRLGSLIAAGTSICGISAIVAVAPVVEAPDEETSYAVATIALFGMVALFAYPFLAHLLFGDATRAGLFLGTSIHDTSQVVGAGLAYAEQFGAPEALDTAVVTKLVRNVSMVGIIPLMGLLHAPDRDAGAERPPLVPFFVLGFLGMALLRTAGDLGGQPFGLLSPGAWSAFVGGTQYVAETALLLAMAAVGLGTRLRDLLGLGLRPLAVGLVAAVTVGGVSIALIQLLSATRFL